MRSTRAASHASSTFRVPATAGAISSSGRHGRRKNGLRMSRGSKAPCGVEHSGTALKAWCQAGGVQDVGLHQLQPLGARQRAQIFAHGSCGEARRAAHQSGRCPPRCIPARAGLRRDVPQESPRPQSQQHGDLYSSGIWILKEVITYLLYSISRQHVASLLVSRNSKNACHVLMRRVRPSVMSFVMQAHLPLLSGACPLSPVPSPSPFFFLTIVASKQHHNATKRSASSRFCT
jgi:hypothetical protein